MKKSVPLGNYGGQFPRIYILRDNVQKIGLLTTTEINVFKDKWRHGAQILFTKDSLIVQAPIQVPSHPCSCLCFHDKYLLTDNLLVSFIDDGPGIPKQT